MKQGGTQDDEQGLDRPPLEAGDPISWHALTQGTCLEGLTWPGWEPLRRDRPRILAIVEENV